MVNKCLEIVQSQTNELHEQPWSQPHVLPSQQHILICIYAPRASVLHVVTHATATAARWAALCAGRRLRTAGKNFLSLRVRFCVRPVPCSRCCRAHLLRAVLLPRGRLRGADAALRASVLRPSAPDRDVSGPFERVHAGCCACATLRRFSFFFSDPIRDCLSEPARRRAHCMASAAT